MKVSLNPNRAKIHRNYTVEDVADLYGVHKTTVRNWIKAGLAVCDSRRPVLILGSALREFIAQKRGQRKHQCRPYELYCLRCKAPQRPAGDMVDYIHMTSSTGRLEGLCPVCDGMMNRYSSMAKLEPIQAVLDVSIRRAVEHITQCGNPLLNSTSEQGVKAC